MLAIRSDAGSVADALLQPGASVIVNSFISNWLGLPSSAVYAATKAVMRSMVRVLAAELAAQKIRVNAISPGPVETPIAGKMGMSPEQVQGMMAGMTAKVPLGRVGQPGEIASIALFLACSEFLFITGLDITTDGDWTDIGG